PAGRRRSPGIVRGGGAVGPTVLGLGAGDRLREAGLVARGSVGVNDLLLRRGVDDAEGLRQELLGLGGIAALDGGAQALDGGAQARTGAAVALPLLGVLADSLLGGLGVGHTFPLGWLSADRKNKVALKCDQRFIASPPISRQLRAPAGARGRGSPRRSSGAGARPGGAGRCPASARRALRRRRPS